MMMMIGDDDNGDDDGLLAIKRNNVLFFQSDNLFLPTVLPGSYALSIAEEMGVWRS